MSNYLIVGGGVSGLGAASLLAKQQIPFVGLEKSDHLGGRFQFGNQRFYRQQTATELQEIFPEIRISQLEDRGLERSKSDWKEVGNGLLSSEEYYFRSPFYLVESQPLSLLPTELASKFELKKTVTKVVASEKKVVCQDGSEYFYDKLVWTGGLKQLNRLWADDKTPVLKVISKLEEACGGIYLEWETNRKLLPTSNSVLFPFRFRDEKLRAIGREQSQADGKFSIQWILFLENELTEDREEVAKRLRSFRRELEKDVPDTVGAITQERIVFWNGISGEKPVKVTGVEALKDVILLGPEVCLAHKEQAETLNNLDLSLWNVGQFARFLALDGSNASVENHDATSQPLESNAIENAAETVIERAGG